MHVTILTRILPWCFLLWADLHFPTVERPEFGPFLFAVSVNVRGIQEGCGLVNLLAHACIEFALGTNKLQAFYAMAFEETIFRHVYGPAL